MMYGGDHFIQRRIEDPFVPWARPGTEVVSLEQCDCKDGKHYNRPNVVKVFPPIGDDGHSTS